MVGRARVSVHYLFDSQYYKQGPSTTPIEDWFGPFFCELGPDQSDQLSHVSPLKPSSKPLWALNQCLGIHAGFLLVKRKEKKKRKKWSLLQYIYS